MIKNKLFKTFDEYLQAQTDASKELLTKLRACILSAAPDAVEMFNYNIPAFSLIEDGKRDQQIMIAGYPKHVGLYPHPSVIEHFKDELKDYKTGKGSVQFPLDRPLPEELIVEMVRYRKSEIEERVKVKPSVKVK